MRTPVWTAGLVMTIALGIAGNVSVAGFVRGLITQGPPLPADAISVFRDDGRRTAGPSSFDEFTALRARTDLFRSLGAVRERQEEAWLRKRRLLVSVATITPEAAALLELPVERGLVVSHRLWDEDLVGVRVDGQMLQVDGVDRPVGAVAPEWLDGLYRGRRIDLWEIAPAGPPPDRAVANYWMIGRLQDRVELDAAQREAAAIGQGLQVLPYTGLLPEAAAGIARIGRLLRAAAIAVFVIACANVASFLLARATAREREIAVRLAIGASRRQLIQQVLADSVLIALAGAAGGAVLAIWIAQIVPAMLFQEDAAQMVFAVEPWGAVLIIAACVTITVLCGLLPMLEARHDDPGAIMQRENSGPSRFSIRLGAGLVVAQMTACTLLVISAGLLISGFRSALLTTAGRRLSAPIVVSLETLQQTSKSQERSAGLQYFDDAARAARELAGATTVAWVATVPGNRPVWQSFVFESARMPRRAIEFERVLFNARTVGATVLPRLAGGLFGPFDTGRCGGVVLSRAAARELGGDRVIGRSLELPSGEWADVIGVVQPRDEPSAARVYHYDWSGESETEAVPAKTAASYRVPEPTAISTTVLDVNMVSPHYFQVMGLPLVTGRDFSATTDACRVAVAHQAAAVPCFNGSAVGGGIIDAYGRRTSIIGVVGSATLRAAARGVAPAVFPMEQDFQPRMSMIAETNGVDRASAARLHRRIAGIPAAVRTASSSPRWTSMSRTALAPERIATVLVGASATIALVLGMLGLYGVMNDAARRRQREFALRMALGAQGRHVIGQVLAEGLRLAIAGSIGGIAGSFLVGRWLAQITPPGDEQSMLIWIAAPAALSLAVAIASVLPARKALASDPILIMREP